MAVARNANRERDGIHVEREGNNADMASLLHTATRVHTATLVHTLPSAIPELLESRIQYSGRLLGSYQLDPVHQPDHKDEAWVNLG